MLTFFVKKGTMEKNTDFSSPVRDQLNSIRTVKTDIEQGRSLAWQYDYIERALSLEKRQRYYDERFQYDNALTKAERKELDTRLDELAKTASKYNISLESIAEADMLANRPALKSHVEKLNSVIGQVQNFDAAKHDVIVMGDEVLWLLRAVSKSEREKMFSEYNLSGTFQDLFDKKLNALSLLAAKKIASYKPKLTYFKYKNITEENLLKEALGDSETIKIHQIGFASDKWQIQKNEMDIPQKRFKVGYMWARNSQDDFAYCRLYQINIIQDYEGGSKYGASYAVVIESRLVACP
jgi:hypothetical protein